MLTLFEDVNLLAISKPANRHCLPQRPLSAPKALSEGAEVSTGNSGELSLAEEMAQTRGHDPHVPDFGLLHRLDYGTTGVLLFAKNLETYTDLRDHWKDPSQIQKTYRAIVRDEEGAFQESLPPLPLKISIPIGHSPKARNKMIAIKSERFKVRSKPQACTTTILAAKITEPKKINFDSGSLLELQIKIDRGVRHQIRVHLAAVGLPILGDALYGKAQTSERATTPRRIFLHAEEIQIQGGPTIQAPLPDDWSRD